MTSKGPKPEELQEVPTLTDSDVSSGESDGEKDDSESEEESQDEEKEGEEEEGDSEEANDEVRLKGHVCSKLISTY